MAHSKHPSPPTPRGLGHLDGGGRWKGFPFVFSWFGAVRGVSIASWWLGAFWVSRSGCRWGKCFENVGIFTFSRMLDFQMLEFRIFRFSDVGIFGFSEMLDFQMFGCWWIVTSNAFVLGWMILQIWRTVKLTFRNPCKWIVTSDAFVLSWMTLRNLRNSKRMFPPA